METNSHMANCPSVNIFFTVILTTINYDVRKKDHH